MSAFTLAEEETLAALIDAVAPAAVVLIGAAAVDLHVPMAWLPIDDERRYDDEVLADQVPYDDVPALLLGRAIATVARAPHLEVVRRFLDRVGDEANSAHGLMLKHGPVAWRNDEDRLVRRLAALRRGIGL